MSLQVPSAAAEVGNSYPERWVDLIANLDLNNLTGCFTLVQSFAKRRVDHEIAFSPVLILLEGRHGQAVSHGGPHGRHNSVRCMSRIARRTMRAQL